MLVVGCIHGNECEGMVVVNALLRTHPHEDLWLLPNLNPDGYDVRHRGNANGIDLNRTFPNGRQPETRVAVALIKRLHPDVTIWFHQAENRVRAWGGSEAVARRYARLSGMRYAVGALAVGRGDALAEHGAARAELRRRATGRGPRARGRSRLRCAPCSASLTAG